MKKMGIVCVMVMGLAMQDLSASQIEFSWIKCNTASFLSY